MCIATRILTEFIIKMIGCYNLTIIYEISVIISEKKICSVYLSTSFLNSGHVFVESFFDFQLSFEQRLLLLEGKVDGNKI